jgi:glycosyltransferase involved in cell wall biosynthesis
MKCNPIRIAYDGTIFTSQATGGISRYFRRLIEEMTRLRPDWLFDLHIVDDGCLLAPLPSGRNVSVVRRKHFRPGWCCVPLNYASRQYKVRHDKPWIVHSTLARPFHYAPCPLVTTIHDAIIEKLPQFYATRHHARARRWWRWSAKHSDAILTVSENSKADILSIWSPHPSKVHVTYPGVDKVFSPPNPADTVTALTGSGIRRPYILYVGHRGEHKNFQIVATALRNPLLKALDLVLVGGANEVPELEGWSSADKKRLHHLTCVSDKQLHGLYAGATALVFPSLYEGFGFPLVEAMSSGAPVVASDIPSSREVCSDCAEYFQPRDPDGCVQAILRAESPTRREGLIRKGLERARLFSWSACAEATLRVYEGLIAERSPDTSWRGAS